MRRVGTMKLLRTALIAAVVTGCSANSSHKVNPNDPFDDPFFDEGMESNSLDDVMHGTAPSVGYLSKEGTQSSEDQLLSEHAGPIWGEDHATDDTFAPGSQ